MINTLIPLFVVIVVPTYFLWRYWSALKVRAGAAQDVDLYLGKDVPEPMKHLVYHAFSESLNVTLPFRIMFSFIYASEHGDNIVKKLKTNHGTVCYKEMQGILVKTLLVNISRAPLSYLACTSIVVSILIARLISRTLSFNGISKSVQSAVYKTVE